MVQIIPRQGFATNLAQGLAEGLSEQLPQEMQRYRLSKGLEQLGKPLQPGQKPMNAMEQMAALSRAGLNPEQLGQFLPLIREAQQREAFIRSARGQGGAVSPQSKGAAATTTAEGMAEGQQPKVPQPITIGGMYSEEDIQDFKNSMLRQPDFNDVQRLAADYLESGRAFDTNSAVNMANVELNTNLEAQRKNLANLRASMDDQLKREVSEGGIDANEKYGGEVIQKLLNQAEYDVGRLGMSPEAAANKASEALKELDQAAVNIRQSGKGFLPWDRYKSKIDTIKTNRAAYEKYGLESQFDDLAAATLGVTPIQMAKILEPSKNEEFAKIVKKGKKLADVLDPFGAEVITMSDKDMDNLVNSIKRDDNILSLMEVLRDNRRDITQFRAKLKEKNKKGDFLTEKQRKQLGKPVGNSMYGDVMYKVFGSE